METELDTTVRNLIIKYLYDDRKKDPGGFGIERNNMLDKLQLPDSPEIMDFHMLYLEEKRLVKLEKDVDSLWAEAKLTALGIDTVESRQKSACVPIKKWEYKTVTVTVDLGIERIKAAREEREPDFEIIQDVLNIWGEKGWELIAIIAQDILTYAYFKRPK